MKIRSLWRHIHIYLIFLMVILFVYLPFLPSRLAASPSGKSGLFVESFEGNVRVESAGGEQSRNVKLHMSLNEGDRISAGQRSSLFLSSDRGNFLRLYEYGRVEVKSLQGKFLVFRYISGSVYANTIRDLGTGVAFDLGYGKKVYMYGVGAFRIEGTKRGGWNVVVREGKVRITHERGEVVLTKGETLRSEGERLVRGPAASGNGYDRTYPYYNGRSYRYYSSYGYNPGYGYYYPYYSGYYPYYGGYYPYYGFSFGYYGGHHGHHGHYGGHYGYGYGGGHYYGGHHGHGHHGHHH